MAGAEGLRVYVRKLRDEAAGLGGDDVLDGRLGVLGAKFWQALTPESVADMEADCTDVEVDGERELEELRVAILWPGLGSR